MAIFEFQQPRFTEGVLAKSLQGRSSEEFYTYGVKAAKNMIPLLEGPLIKRPGTIYISTAGNTTSRLFPFYKGGTEAYVVEIGYDSSASATTKTNCTSSGSPATTIVLGSAQSTADLFVGQHVYGPNLDSFTLSCTSASSITVTTADTSSLKVGMVVTGTSTTGIIASQTIATIPSGTTFTLSATATATGTQALTFSALYPTTEIDSSTQIASISSANTTTFTLTNAVTTAISTGTLNFSNKPFIRIYSQDRLLSVQGTSTPYIVKSHRWVTVTDLDEIASIETSQSGDVLFFTCPTRKPFLLTRTLDESDSRRAEDNSIWTISEYDSEDGPYGNVNAENTLSMLITATSPNTEVDEDVADVQVDIKNNLFIVANHGLQTGQRINLHVDNIANAKTGNTQVIVKDGTVDPTVTVDVTSNSTTNKFSSWTDSTATTAKSHGLNDNDIIHFGGAFPTGGSWSGDATTDYFVVTSRLYTFQVALIEGGTALTFGVVGSSQFFGTNKASEGGAFLPGDKLML